MKIKCKICKKVIEVWPYEVKENRQYCGRKCYFIWRGKNFRQPLKARLKISKSLIGNKHGFQIGKKSWITGKVNIWVLAEKNINWKGNKVGYRALHRWIRSRKFGGNICEFCGKLKTTPKSIHLANKTGKYLRNLTDWLWLCVKCHKKYDKKI